MIITKDVLNLEKENVFKQMKKWTLTENGEIINTWWICEMYKGCMTKEYRYIDRDKDNELCIGYETHTKVKNGGLYALHYPKILAQADTKKELIEYKKKIGLKKKRKITSNQASKILECLGRKEK